MRARLVYTLVLKTLCSCVESGTEVCRMRERWPEMRCSATSASTPGFEACADATHRVVSFLAFTLGDYCFGCGAQGHFVVIRGSVHLLPDMNIWLSLVASMSLAVPSTMHCTERLFFFFLHFFFWSQLPRAFYQPASAAGTKQISKGWGRV